MAEKWNDKLRRKMAEYSETPPAGLWEGIEASLQSRRAAAFPWWWALAGVAAAVLAVLLLWRPGPATPELATDAVAVVAPEEKTEPQTAEPQSVEYSRPFASRPSAVEEIRPVANTEPETDAPEAEAPEAVEPAPVPQEPVQPKPVEPSPVPQTRVPQTPVPQTQYPAEKLDTPAPLVTFSLIAGGVPGGAVANSYTSYAMSAVQTAAASTTGKVPVALLSRNKQTENDVRHSIALRAGAMFSVPIGRYWGVETGLQLSNLLTKTTSTTGNMTTVTNRTISYVGLPLYAVYTPLRFGNGAVYASAGPMIEYGFRSSGTTEDFISGGNVGSEKFSTRISDLVWSLNLNAGVQWLIGGVGGLFVQPGLSWYIPGQSKEETFYTEHPLSFALSAGFRFSF